MHVVDDKAPRYTVEGTHLKLTQTFEDGATTPKIVAQLLGENGQTVSQKILTGTGTQEDIDLHTYFTAVVAAMGMEGKNADVYLSARYERVSPSALSPKHQDSYKVILEAGPTADELPDNVKEPKEIIFRPHLTLVR